MASFTSILNNFRNSAIIILIDLKNSNNIVSVIKTWYEFIGNNRSEYELDELANVLGTFFNLRYAKEHKKYENLFVILSSALLENNTDHPIDIICSKLKKDVNSLDETDTMMLLRIIDM